MRAEVIVYDDQGETVRVFTLRAKTVVLLKRALGLLAFKDFLGENAARQKQWKAEQK